MKNTTTKIKNTVDRINTRRKGAKERISKLEVTTKITQSEQQRENRPKINRVLGTCETITKDLTFMSSQKERRKRTELKMYLKK